MTEPDWKPVESSAVAALWFEELGTIPQRHSAAPEAWGRLYVRFLKGAVYSYEPVLGSSYFTLLDAESVGRSLWRVLVPGSGRRVESLEHKEEGCGRTTP